MIKSEAASATHQSGAARLRTAVALILSVRNVLPEQLSQFKDNSQYSMLLHLLETYAPQEILLPHTMETTSLYTQLQNADLGFIRCAPRTGRLFLS